jgi:hypothetical protein
MKIAGLKNRSIIDAAAGIVKSERVRGAPGSALFPGRSTRRIFCASSRVAAKHRNALRRKERLDTLCQSGGAALRLSMAGREPLQHACRCKVRYSL